VSFLLQTLIAVIEIMLAFYGFWLIWQVLLPILPGPRDRSKRIARFAGYFTDPLVKPLAKVLHVHPKLLCVLLLLLVAAAQVALGRISL
jgi:predicted PurR-regulated permease PerM